MKSATGLFQEFVPDNLSFMYLCVIRGILHTS
jgi:hypothetical protein